MIANMHNFNDFGIPYEGRGHVAQANNNLVRNRFKLQEIPDDELTYAHATMCMSQQCLNGASMTSYGDSECWDWTQNLTTP